jgi:hypothetical protein
MNAFRLSIAAVSLLAIAGVANAAAPSAPMKMHHHAKMHVMAKPVHCAKGVKTCPVKKSAVVIKASAKKPDAMIKTTTKKP